ncbi:MAG: hypothetical protein ACON39_04075 [Coraliomargaritaceae bacterium]
MKTHTPNILTVPSTTQRANHTSQIVEIDGESFVVINQLQEMPGFFLSMVSAGNHWFFVSTNGALSAGRKSPDHALFPYYTVDKLTANWNCTGPQTIIQCNGITWEPFKPYDAARFPVEQRIYKNLNGDSVIFEETNKQLDLCYRYRWRTSAKYGFIRTVSLHNRGDDERNLHIVDGLADLLPSGIDARTQLSYSCLVDAYRLSEYTSENKLLVHRMAASLIDEAVPLECLLATTVWSVGWPQSDILLSLKEAQEYIEKPIQTTQDKTLRSTRGAYFNAGQISLSSGASHQWSQVADIDASQSKVAELAEALKTPEKVFQEVLLDTEEGSQRLEELIASADGLQVSQDTDMTTHHRANVLYNIMRGGVFPNGYTICPDQFRDYIGKLHLDLPESDEAWLNALPETPIHRTAIIELSATASPKLQRACAEYLPLVFSRRHGDPSRPWNHFTIQTTNDLGKPIVGFQGNWRDIFQNWEALAWSFPHYNTAFIHKFLNATTADGYNPYRITSEGIEWEEPDEEDPWASIGYWGDHQIVYLLKLLEFAEDLDPSAISQQLDKKAFVFADVPYEIKSQDELEADPKHSIHFNRARNKEISNRVAAIGADGKLVHREEGQLMQACLLEKLLLPALVKLSNLVPGGGIWMNTQRPEWNDANNALAGNGLSIVTTCYLHRYILFLERLLKDRKESFSCFDALADFLREMNTHLKKDPEEITKNNQARYQTLRAFGLAGESYRNRIYSRAFGKSESVPMDEISQLLANARRHIAHTITLNRRRDGLYHAYNILHLKNQSAEIEFLDPMLEGQVAALSSQAITPEETLTILEALPESPLYCPRRRSYILYPDKQLPSFLDFNKVPTEEALARPLIAKMHELEDPRLLCISTDDCMRFNPKIRNRFELDQMLDELAADKQLKKLIQADREPIHQLFEKTFNHNAFTGRSGSMFAYEGLGSIYWHMVSKLMLSALEVTLDKDNQHLRQALTKSYYNIQSGLGFRQSPAEYGAFPADAYSHTPSHSGACQPGLTGMVKEGILCRFLELGVHFEKGCLQFRPSILRKAELTLQEEPTEFVRMNGTAETILVPSESLLFTFAQTPVVYQRSESDEPQILIHFRDGTERTLHSDTLDSELTEAIIGREDRIQQVIVYQPAERFIESI